jgi:NAD(P)-dependent dehydrogenase (short-subunit alcohol dehydrogenase family)
VVSIFHATVRQTLNAGRDIPPGGKSADASDSSLQIAPATAHAIGWHAACPVYPNMPSMRSLPMGAVRSEQKQPPQKQDRQPGRETRMDPQPISIRASYRGSGKLAGKAALVTGGDSGIGRAVALHFAREGAKVAIVYLEEHEDAHETRRLVEAEGQPCLLISADLRSEAACRDAVSKTAKEFGRLDILVNNVAEQHPQEEVESISEQQLKKTFETNVFSYVYTTQAALDHLGEGASIINTGSVTGSRGHKELIDYASTKGAIQALTFSLAQALAERKIRVNAVAPGPVWTPLIPASFSPEKVAKFGANTLMKRPGQPAEIGPAYVFLASEDASYITGQFIHINGGGFIAA